MKGKTAKTVLFSLMAAMFLSGCEDIIRQIEDYYTPGPVTSNGKSYTVSFDGNGGRGRVPGPITQESATKIYLPDADGLSRPNYTFGGWNTNTSGSRGTNYPTGAEFTVPTRNVTLYANWEEEGDGIIPVTGVRLANRNLTNNSLALELGETETLTATVSPRDATNKNVTWATSDPSVATVREGTVSAKSPGEAIIMVIAAADGTMTDSCVVTVEGRLPAVAVSGVSLDKSSLSLAVGESETLTATVSPGNATRKHVTWTTSNSSVATVSDSGTVTAVKEGTATITVTTADRDIRDSCLVTVSSGSSPGGIDSITGLANKLAWLQSNAQSGGSYTVEVNADESIGPQTLSYSGRNNITITLRGVGSNRTISLSSNGSMFTVNSGVTLVLDNNITLQGRSGNINPVILVFPGGTFRMNSGSIKNNTTNNSREYDGGGVAVYGGAFIMSGGTISDNSSLCGAGVVVVGANVYFGTGTFTMSGGTISGNTAYNLSYGGGVYVGTNGSFTMSGGTISNNSTISNNDALGGAQGGGVALHGPSTFFTMNNGTISGNSSYAGGGVSVITGGTFTMNGGTISGNTANYRGGGVNVWPSEVIFRNNYPSGIFGNTPDNVYP